MVAAEGLREEDTRLNYLIAEITLFLHYSSHDIRKSLLHSPMILLQLMAHQALRYVYDALVFTVRATLSNGEHPKAGPLVPSFRWVCCVLTTTCS